MKTPKKHQQAFLCQAQLFSTSLNKSKHGYATFKLISFYTQIFFENEFKNEWPPGDFKLIVSRQLIDETGNVAGELKTKKKKKTDKHRVLLWIQIN